MAKIFILDQHNKQVGTVDFVFSRESRESYLFVDVDTDYAATFPLRLSTVLNAAGKAVASLVCCSNGKDVGGNVAPVGRTFPSYGSINGAKTSDYDCNGDRVIGEVTQNYVRNESKGVVGELSLYWGSEDEEFFQQSTRAFANQRNLTPDRAYALVERLRPIMYQNMMNLAGCTALIMKLFEQKKRGLFG